MFHLSLAFGIEAQTMQNGGFENGMNFWTLEGVTECKASVMNSDNYNDSLVIPYEGNSFLKMFSDKGATPDCKIKTGFKTASFSPKSFTLIFNSYYINSDSARENLNWRVYFYNTQKPLKFIKEIGFPTSPRNNEGKYNFSWGSAGALNIATNIKEDVDSIVIEFKSGSYDGRAKNFLLYLDNVSLSFKTAGINNFQKRELKIYPVPCTDMLKIETESAGMNFYQIFNLQGMEVLSGSLLQQNEIDVSRLSSGFYTLRAIDESGTYWQQKFIKQ